MQPKRSSFTLVNEKDPSDRVKVVLEGSIDFIEKWKKKHGLKGWKKT